MSWWSRLFGDKAEGDLKPKRLDYLSEALVLERQGDFDAALTSYRLALRDSPNEPKIHMNMAIAFSRTGRQDEAIRSYRRALEISPDLSGAHYGLAFILIKRNERNLAINHLTAFLENPPKGPESERWIQHARDTLQSLHEADTTPSDPAPSDTEA
jgi:tetratricopeptide (TPR) repeat protein